MHGSNGISPAIFETLRRLGLTEYGARCYVALLSLKSGEASTIAEAAEVPRTKVYATLKDLADAGWIIASVGRPVVYRPVAPNERIAQAEKKLSEEADAATRELQARFAVGAQMLPVSCYMIRGREAVEEKAIELVARAREELLVNLGFAYPSESHALVEALRKAQRRGVTIRLLLGPDVDERALGEFARNARAAVFPFRGIVCDWRQALVALPQVVGEPVALWNPTQAFVEAITPLLRGAWERAPTRG